MSRTERNHLPSVSRLVTSSSCRRKPTCKRTSGLHMWSTSRYLQRASVFMRLFPTCDCHLRNPMGDSVCNRVPHGRRGPYLEPPLPSKTLKLLGLPTIERRRCLTSRAPNHCTAASSPRNHRGPAAQAHPGLLAVVRVRAGCRRRQATCPLVVSQGEFHARCGRGNSLRSAAIAHCASPPSRW
jgi:hypothetical protein